MAATGVPGHATVRGVCRSGFYMAPRSSSPLRQLGFELEVHPDSAPDYVATAAGLLTGAEEAALTPGAEAAIRFDPSHPSTVVVVGPMAASAG